MQKPARSGLPHPQQRPVWLQPQMRQGSQNDETWEVGAECCSHSYGPWPLPRPPTRRLSALWGLLMAADRHHSWASFPQEEEAASTATAKAILQDPGFSMQAY